MKTKFLYVVTLFLIFSCGAKKKEEELERLSLGGKTFRNVAFKQLDSSTWLKTGGSRVISFTVNEDEEIIEMRETFTNYSDIAGLCSGFYEMSVINRGDAGETIENSDSEFYDVFTPYQRDNLLEEDTNLIQDFELEVSVIVKSLSFGSQCSMTIYNNFDVDLRTYPSGEIVFNDYSRSLTFLYEEVK